MAKVIRIRRRAFLAPCIVAWGAVASATWVCVCSFPIDDLKWIRPIHHVSMNSALFASSPTKRERRRKRDVLRSWSSDLFGKAMTASANRTGHTMPRIPRSSSSVQIPLPVSFFASQSERESTRNPTGSTGTEPSMEMGVAAKTAEVHQTPVQPATRALLAEIRQAVRSNDGMVTLPSIRTDQASTALEREFREMLSHFTVYTRRDMLGIQDPTKRVLFQGIAASADCPEVYRAFEVLFQDLPPLRLAGRVVFKLLQKFMVKSVGQHRDEIALLSNVVNASPHGSQQLEELRLLFIMASSQSNGGGQLTAEQLLRTGAVNRTALDILGFESPSQLIDRLEQTADGKVSFVNLVTGLWNCAEDVCGLDRCDPHRVLYELLVEINDQLAGSITVDTAAHEDIPSKIKNGARYDSMVKSFVEWKDRLPDSHDRQESRRMQVVRGCFVGAEIPEVVAALRIVYVEYRGLRIAGDLIFALVSQRMKRRK